MYGPPPSPAEITVIAPWWSWLLCGLFGMLIMAIGTRAKYSPQIRLTCLTLAFTILLTAPTLFLPTDMMWGAYPTIDKKTSFLFYLDKAHWLPLGSIEGLKQHAPLFLIGIHICHLWFTELIDLFVSSTQAVNLHAFLNLFLSSLFAGMFIQRRLPEQLWCCLIGGLSFGLSLHQLRDIQWYTLEKTGIYWLPLFLLALDAAQKRKWHPMTPALIWCAAALYNLYVALILAGMGVLMGLWNRKKEMWMSLGLCGLGGLIIGGIQLWLMGSGPSLAAPEDFQMRAALDVVELLPPLWNRLELWRIVSPLMCLGLVFAVKERLLRLQDMSIALVFFLLSLGPNISEQIVNPIYAVLSFLPGMWRMAKPEFFFSASFLFLAVWASEGLAKRGWNRYPKRLMGAFVLLWILGCRLHPAYPYTTTYIPAKLDPNWEERVFKDVEKHEHLLPSSAE